MLHLPAIVSSICSERASLSVKFDCHAHFFHSYLACSTFLHASCITIKLALPHKYSIADVSICVQQGMHDSRALDQRALALIISHSLAGHAHVHQITSDCQDGLLTSLHSYCEKG